MDKSDEIGRRWLDEKISERVALYALWLVAVMSDNSKIKQTIF